MSRKNRERRTRRPPKRSFVEAHRAVILAAGALLALGLLFWWGGRETPVRRTGMAPTFTLPSTDGRSVSLSSYRGSPVLLYFSEGVGCDPCFTQMTELERSGSGLDRLGVTFMPIMVNPAPMVTQEAARFGVHTPVLVDETMRVSDAYGTLGTGHHADLPGHSFILVDGSGRIRWRGDYPSMWVPPEQLVDEVARALKP